MAIANEFLKKPGALGRLTQMQLLKLAYIAHGWNLAVNGAPLLAQDVRAWDYGPVVPELYDHVRLYGKQPITRPIKSTDNEAFRFFRGGQLQDVPPYETQLSAEEREVIDRVWQRYGQYSGLHLSQLTHRQGTPWFQTYFGEGKNAVIPNPRIRAHYVELAQAV